MKSKILFATLLLSLQLQAQCWQDYEPGYNHSVVLNTDGRIRAIGYNGYGQIGNGNNIQQYNFTLSGTARYIAVSGGGNHTMGIRNDGTLWTWGRNVQGELGLGIPGNQNVPNQVGTDNDWIKIWAGSFNCFAQKSNGTLWSWGLNYYGQLGHPGTTPQQVGTDTDWAEVAPMPNSTYVLKTNGSLWYLGITPNPTATQFGNDTDWVKISGGYDHMIGLKSDGSIWTWGSNASGQLGNPLPNPDGSPERRVGTDNDWIAVSAGGDHCVAIKNDGSMWSWGDGSYGALGLGSSQNYDTPQRVGTDNDWESVRSEGAHNMAMKTNAKLYSWGENTYAQLGTTTAANRPGMNSCPTLLDAKSFDQEVFALFPNPAGNILEISKPFAISGFRIYDPMGKMVQEAKGNISQVDVSQLSSGLYLIEMLGKNGKFLKFIKD